VQVRADGFTITVGDDPDTTGFSTQFPVHQFLRPQQSNMNAQLYNFMATLLKRHSFRESTKVVTRIA
jgi:hypothetical protein